MLYEVITEPASDEDRESYRRYAKRLLLALVAVGALVFGAAELAGLSLVKLYASSWMSLACAILATLVITSYSIHYTKLYESGFNIGRPVNCAPV